VRHAHATRGWLELCEFDGGIRLEIWDDGQVIDAGRVLAARNPKRLGLVGMRERVEMVGGPLAVESAPGLRLEREEGADRARKKGGPRRAA